MRKQRQRLQRLAQPHVVGEDAAEPVPPQEREPLEPGALIRAQQRVKRRRRRGVLDRRPGGSGGRGAPREKIEQALHLALPRRGLMADHAEAGQLVPQAGLEPADAQRAVQGGRLVRQRAGLLDQPGERHQLRLVEREVGTVRQQQVRLAAGQCHEQLGERDLAALHGDGDAEVEPVLLAVEFGRGHADPQRVPGLPVVRHPAGHLHPHVVAAGQQRQHLGAEHHRVETVQGGGGETGPFREIEIDTGQHPRFRGGIAELGGPGADRGSQLRVANLVRPFPAEVHVVGAEIPGAEH